MASLTDYLVAEVCPVNNETGARMRVNMDRAGAKSLSGGEGRAVRPHATRATTNVGLGSHRDLDWMEEGNPECSPFG